MEEKGSPLSPSTKTRSPTGASFGGETSSTLPSGLYIVKNGINEVNDELCFVLFCFE